MSDPQPQNFPIVPVAELLGMPDETFIGVAMQALDRYVMGSGAFDFRKNFNMSAANGPVNMTPLPDRQHFYMYPSEASDLIWSGLDAIQQFAATQAISAETREKFVRAFSADNARLSMHHLTTKEEFNIIAGLSGEFTDSQVKLFTALSPERLADLKEVVRVHVAARMDGLDVPVIILAEDAPEENAQAAATPQAVEQPKPPAP